MSDSKLYIIELGGDIGDIATMHRLVRCKECVWGKAVEQVGCLRFEDRGSDGLKDPDGFCAWGEKGGLAMTAPTSDERHRVAERLREQPQWTIDTEFLEMLGYLCDAVYDRTDGEIDPYMWGLQRDLADLLDENDSTRCEDCRFADTLSCMPGRVLCKRNGGVWRPGDSCSRGIPAREGDVADDD